MIRKRTTNRRLPSPGLVVAIVALVAALAGTAVALPGKNSVDGNDLRKNVVKTKNLRNKSVTASKLGIGAVRTARIANDAVTGDKIADGTVGAGDLGVGSVTGAEIVNGTVTSEELSLEITVRTALSPNTTDADGTQNGPAGPVATASATASCLDGETLIGGGARWTTGNNDNNENLYINESYPLGQDWVAQGIVDFGAQGQARVQARAICLG